MYYLPSEGTLESLADIKAIHRVEIMILDKYSVFKSHVTQIQGNALQNKWEKGTVTRKCGTLQKKRQEALPKSTSQETSMHWYNTYST